MSTEKPQTGPWGRRLWNGVALLTAIGLAGPVIIFLKSLPALQAAASNACDNTGLVDGLIGFGLIWLVVLAGLAGLGLLMFWLRSPAGPLVLLFCNLVMMAVYGVLHPVGNGDIAWGLVVVDLAAVPAIAAALVLWPLLTRWALWVRVVEFVIIAAIALPVSWLFAYGVTNDIGTALTVPPPPPPAYVSTAPPGTYGGCAARPGAL
jgi:hypothetical protein